mgnify:CR=1 FL=1
MNRRSSTVFLTTFLAPLEALEDASPLEVEERDSHDGETDVDSDDHGPVCARSRRVLLSHELVLDFEAGAV